MRHAVVVVCLAALAGVGCKKDKDKPAAGTGSDTTATQPKPSEPKSGEPATPPTAGKAKSCEELGGTKAGDTCNLKGPAPFETTFTGKFDSTAMRPEPGAVFKVKNKLDFPVNVASAQLYAYDKAGKQLDLDLAGTKGKYAQDSKLRLIELGPGETKEFVHSIGKPNLPPEMDTLQLEIIAWTLPPDDKATFAQDIADMENRPKDGWK